MFYFKPPQGNARVEGQLDTVGQMSSYGSVDFWPSGNSMFSFGDPRHLRFSKKKHHIHIQDGLLTEDGSECQCVAR